MITRDIGIVYYDVVIVKSSYFERAWSNQVLVLFAEKFERQEGLLAHHSPPFSRRTLRAELRATRTLAFRKRLN